MKGKDGEELRKREERVCSKNRITDTDREIQTDRQMKGVVQ